MARKRAGAEEAPGKVKVNLSLDAQLARRLAAFAGYHRLEMSEVVAKAVERELKGFVVAQREVAAAAEGAEAPRLAATG